MKKHPIFKNFIWFFFLFGCAFSSHFLLQVQAEETGNVTITGLKEEEILSIYQIAGYEDLELQWNEKIEEWIQEKAYLYRGLKPERLKLMTELRAKEFCGLAITETEDFEPILQEKYSEEEEGYQISLPSGYYVILPESYDRIYEIKWFSIDPEEAVEIQYQYGEETKDYSIPQIDTTVTLIGDEEQEENPTEVQESPPGNSESEELASEESQAEEPLEDDEGLKPEISLVKDDEVKIEAKILFPKYPHFYAAGKKVTNVYVAIPPGMEYTEDSLSFCTEEGELEAAYSIQKFQEAVVYQDTEENLLMFGTSNGYYYEFDGSEILQGTGEEAWEAYQRLINPDSPHEDDITQEQEPVEEETPSISTGWTILILSIDTETEVSDLIVTYQAIKNGLTNDTGYYPCETGLVYSISPKDTGKRGKTFVKENLISCGFKITVCIGTGYNQYTNPEEILKNGERLTGATFTIYQYHGIFTEGKIIEKEATEEPLEEPIEAGEPEEADRITEPPKLPDEEQLQMVRNIYDKELDITKEYSLVAMLGCNADGEASIGGLAQGEYLIEETTTPQGYTYTLVDLFVSEDSWEDEEEMQGKYLMEFVWLDYPTVYLPGTGKHGTAMYTWFGTLIAGTALILLRLKTKRKVIVFVYDKKKNNQDLNIEENNTILSEEQKGEIL